MPQTTAAPGRSAIAAGDTDSDFIGNNFFA
jgi:hypothetical protein